MRPLVLGLWLAGMLLAGHVWAQTLPGCTVTLAELNTHLQADLRNVGYAAPLAAGNDAEVARLANAVREGAAFEVDRKYVATEEVIKKLNPGDLKGLAAGDKQTLLVLLGKDRLDIADPNIRTILAEAFPAAGQTRPALIPLQKRQGSDMEKLGGAGCAITHFQVACARRGAC